MTHIEHVTSADKQALDCAEMRKLCEAATPGPWYQGSWEQPPIEGAKELSDLLCYFDDEERPRFWSWNTDGKFVAAARTFIPWALSELESQKRRIEELEAEKWDTIEKFKAFRSSVYSGDLVTRMRECLETAKYHMPTASVRDEIDAILTHFKEGECP